MHSCSTCQQNITKTYKTGMQCAGKCAKFFHRKCAGVNKDLFEDIAKDKVVWLCAVCKMSEGRKSLVIGSEDNNMPTGATDDPEAVLQNIISDDHLISNNQITELLSKIDKLIDQNSQVIQNVDRSRACNGCDKYDALVNKIDETMKTFSNVLEQFGNLLSNFQEAKVNSCILEKSVNADFNNKKTDRHEQNYIIGTGPSSDLLLPNTQDNFSKHFVVTPLSITTTEQQIIQYVQSKLGASAGITCSSLLPKNMERNKLTYLNFKIGISNHFTQKVSEAQFWPTGIAVKPFVNFNSKNRPVQLPMETR